MWHVDINFSEGWNDRVSFWSSCFYIFGCFCFVYCIIDDSLVNFLLAMSEMCAGPKLGPRSYVAC